MKTEYMLGVPVDVVDYEMIEQAAKQALDTETTISIASVNPQIIMDRHIDKDAMAYIHEADYRIPDGIGIVKASQLKKGQIKHRVTGIDVMQRLLCQANQYGASIFLYGAKPDIVQQTAQRLQEQYPHVTIAGTIDGYTSLSDEEVVAQINQSQATFLFVALGFPKQESWLYRCKDKLTTVRVMEDVGGSFDVLSGQIKRAPHWIQRLNLEWLYRMIQQPKKIQRLWKMPLFFWHIYKERRMKGMAE